MSAILIYGEGGNSIEIPITITKNMPEAIEWVIMEVVENVIIL